MRKILWPFFSCQSLLLGTNVPNDGMPLIDIFEHEGFLVLVKDIAISCM